MELSRRVISQTRYSRSESGPASHVYESSFPV
jgi:hypothetical protein